VLCLRIWFVWDAVVGWAVHVAAYRQPKDDKEDDDDDD
jgi:hypothetical protein